MYRPGVTSSWIILLLVLALLVPLISCGGGDNTPTTPTATISSPSGEVLVQKLGSETWVEGVSGMKLEVGDRLKTESDGSALILFFEGSVMEVKEDAEIIIEELDVADNGSTITRLRQAVGSTVNRVQQLVDPASQYEIETPAASAVVRGTTFGLQVAQDDNTTIESEEGDVWFTAGGVTVLVSEGMQYNASPGGIPSNNFHIENVAICSEVRGPRDYTVQPDATFAPGDSAFFYFEAFDFAWLSAAGKYETWFQVTDAKVYNPEGGLYISEIATTDFHKTDLDEPPEYLWGTLAFVILPGQPSGQYRVELELTDVFTGGADSITVYFTVEE